MKYSVIIPVYNRPQEIKELLHSLVNQTVSNFEVLIIEDGSTERCEKIVEHFAVDLDIRYYFKKNTGPGHSRNFGMARARGDYFIFFDSDCLLPPDYFETVDARLDQQPLDAFGGPDNAHPSFSNIQKAINHTMTSFITTGGIRGRKKQLDTFQPRSFNMGLSRKVYEKIGGFSPLHPGEDPDLSYRIMDGGFRVGLIAGAYVYHKRRIDFQKFSKQVYKFGIVRTILMKWHPKYTKPVYFLPVLFLMGSAGLIILSLLFSSLWLTPLLLLALFIFFEALLKTRNPVVSFLAVAAAFIQLYSYGIGFLKGIWSLWIQKKEERQVFPKLFFSFD